jgi:hypothetical protein
VSTKARELRKAQQTAWERRVRRRQALIIAAWVSAGLAFAALIIYLAWKENQPIPRTGEDMPIMANTGHIQPVQSHEPYNSDPPTSGPHYEDPAEAGFYAEAPPDEQLIHNLEHGYVIIWYNCSSLTQNQCERLQPQIREAMQSAGVSSRTRTSKLIAVPRPTMDMQLALTTWGRLDKFDAFDRERILNYIRAFRDDAPEPNAP